MIHAHCDKRLGRSVVIERAEEIVILKEPPDRITSILRWDAMKSSYVNKTVIFQFPAFIPGFGCKERIARLFGGVHYQYAPIPLHNNLIFLIDNLDSQIYLAATQPGHWLGFNNFHFRVDRIPE